MRNKKKILLIVIAIIAATVIIVESALLINPPRKRDNSEIYVYITPSGESIGYHIDDNGRPYKYNEYTGEKSELLLYIPSDVFGTVMTSPYVFPTTEPSSSESNTVSPSEAVSN